jgi:hypothetical protein
MVESEASAGKPEPGSRGRSRKKTAKGGRRGDDEEAAGGRIMGETEWAEDEAGERERETRGEAVESQSLSLYIMSPSLSSLLKVIVRGGGVSSSSSAEVAAGRHRVTLGKTGGGEGSGRRAARGGAQSRDPVAGRRGC